MLDNLRNFGKSWIAKILLGILIIAVAGFGIPSVFLDLNANTVARVGDQNISVRDFDRLYRGQMNQIAAQTGTVPTPEQALTFGVPGAVINRLAADASVHILAEDLGLGATDAKIAELVRQDPSFAGALGTFDRSQFVAVLQQSGYSEAEYLNIQRKAAGREQIGMILDGIRLPAIATQIANAYENDRRVIEYVELNPVLFTITDEPSEEELATFFDENQTRFQTEETRRIRLLPLTAAALADGVEVTEAQIAAEYERQTAQFTTVEQRTVHQLPLSTPELVAAFEAGLAEGTPFLEIAEANGVAGNVTNLGTLARTQMTDPTLAQTAFGLDEGAFAIIGGAMGQRAVWVSDVAEGGVQPFDAVRDQLETQLRLAAASQLLPTVYDEVEEARAAFLPIDEVAERHGLTVYELDLTRGGEALAAVAELPEETFQTVVDQVFAASPTARVTPAINLGSNRTAFFEIEDVQPVRDQTLEEVHDEVVAAWQELQTRLQMIETAETMVGEIDSGLDLFSVAAASGQIPQASPPFGRNGVGDGIVDSQVAQAAFVGDVGYAGYAETENGDFVVFQVTDVQPATEDQASQMAQAISASFPNLIYASLVEGLRRDQSVRLNEEALYRVIGLQR